MHKQFGGKPHKKPINTWFDRQFLDVSSAAGVKHQQHVEALEALRQTAQVAPPAAKPAPTVKPLAQTPAPVSPSRTRLLPRPQPQQPAAMQPPPQQQQQQPQQAQQLLQARPVPQNSGDAQAGAVQGAGSQDTAAACRICQWDGAPIEKFGHFKASAFTLWSSMLC